MRRALTGRLTPRETLLYLGQGLLLTLALDYLFFESLWILPLGIPAGILCVHRGRRQKEKRIRRQLEVQFLSAVKSLGTSLYAGYSPENAVLSCRRELVQLYGEEAELCRELAAMERQMQLRVPLEQLFLELAERSRIPDMENFAAVFQTAKRTGGNLGEIVRKTARMLEQKSDVEKEIAATLAARRAEQQIMSAMPAGIILYLKLTSPGFFSSMYGNLRGGILMALCLFVYAAAYVLGQRILEVPV